MESHETGTTASFFPTTARSFFLFTFTDDARFFIMTTTFQFFHHAFTRHMTFELINGTAKI